VKDVRFPKLTRECFVPKKGVLKVSDKLSDAVAYIGTNSMGKPNAVIFYGKQAQPVSNYYYQTVARRDAAVAQAFKDRQVWLAYKNQRKAERVAFVHTYKVGDLFKTCWGYDQTNVEYFEVVEVKGKHLVLREIAQKTVQDGRDSGKCVPLPGQYLKPRYEGDTTGAPIKRLATQYGVKIDDVRSASFVKPELVAGVPVYSPAYYSWGH
jgi:hypothetical protein